MKTGVLTTLLLALFMVTGGFAILVSGGSDNSDESNPNGQRDPDGEKEWYSLTGTVTDLEGNGLEARLTLQGQRWGWDWAHTSQDGTYRLDVTEGNYTLEVSAPDHFPLVEQLTILGDTSLDLELEPLPAKDASLVLTLEGPSQAWAVLKDPNRDWWLDSAWGQTEMVLHGWAGELELEVRPYDAGYLIHHQTVTLVSGETTTLTLTLAPYVESATLTGMVTDQEDLPVASALVTLAKPEVGYRATAFTDETGAYTLDLIPGTYAKINVAAVGYAYSPIEIALLVTEEGPNTLDLTLKAKELVTQPGKVVDHIGQPVSGALVTAWGYLWDHSAWNTGCPECDYKQLGYSGEGASDGFAPNPVSEPVKVQVAQATTGPEGRFSLELPVNENLELKAAAEGLTGDPQWVYTYWFDNYDEKEDGTASNGQVPGTRLYEVKLVLYPIPDVKLSGTVTLPDGDPAAGAYLSFWRDYRPPDEPFWISGVWRHSEVEGGCWYVEGSDGDNYEIVETAFNAALVPVEGDWLKALVQQTEMSTTCQVGQPVKALRLEQKSYGGNEQGDDNENRGQGTDTTTSEGMPAYSAPFSYAWNHRLRGGSTYTDDEGHYALDLYKGTYELTASLSSGEVWVMEGVKSGWEDAEAGQAPNSAGYLGPPLRAPERYRYQATLTLEAGEQVLDIQLEKIEDDAGLAGQVTFSDDSVVGDRQVTLSVSGPDYYNSTTVDGDGNWQMALPHGQTYSYSIWTDDPLVASAWGEVEVGAKGTTTAVADELHVTVLDSTLKGTVTYDGRPVSGATVNLWGLGIGYDPGNGQANDNRPDPAYGYGYGYGYPGDDRGQVESPLAGGQGSANSGTADASAPPQASNGDWEEDWEWEDELTWEEDYAVMPQVYWGPTFTRTVTTDSEGQFSLPVVGGRLYSVGVSYYGTLDIRDVEEYYGAFRHVYVDREVTVELDLELEVQQDPLNKGDAWWEASPNVPRTLDTEDTAFGGNGWRQAAFDESYGGDAGYPGDGTDPASAATAAGTAAAAAAVASQFPWQVAVEWPPAGTSVNANLADPEGTPAVAITIVVFRDGAEYSRATTDVNGDVTLELGDAQAGHDYAFEARAGDEVMAYAAFEDQTNAADPQGDSVLPGPGLLAGLAVVGLTALAARTFRRKVLR